MPQDFLFGLVGGALMGAGCVTLVYFNGRILGVSGLLGGALKLGGGTGWRWAFILGMVSAGYVTLLAYPAAFGGQVGRTLGVTFAGSILAGAGTQLGSGCTSGHAICGLGRFSLRSVVATCTFMATGAATVYVLGHLIASHAS